MALLEARGIRKAYGATLALGGCDLTVEAGSVHALLGENGAGKSTLVKILTGAVRPDEGTIALDGRPVHFRDTGDAARHGVAVVSQELSLFPDLDVLANLFLGREHLRGPFFDRSAMEKLAAPVLEQLHLDVSPRTPLGKLPLADRQMVEIAKALLVDPRVLILDEPTSALDDEGSKRLLQVLAVLRERRVGVVFVSHILEEVMSLSDRITVLRDGQVAMAGVERADVTLDDVVSAMLGQPVRTEEGRGAVEQATVAPPGGRATLEVRGLVVPGELDGVDLTARTGEIVGLAGVAGAGHRTLLEVLGGRRRSTAGAITLPGGEGKPGRHPTNQHRAVRAGVGIVSGDRAVGVMTEKPIWENGAHVRSIALGRDGSWLRKNVMRDRMRRRRDEYGIKTDDVNKEVGSLSGGNQQKVALAKWLEASPGTLLLDDPTRGVDVGSKAELHRLIRTFSTGSVVLLCSTDLDELVDLCDRVLVFRRGRITAELAGETLTRHTLLTEINTSEQAQTLPETAKG
ncbi:sugar ABC transporter ATP-binding protein [Georgenia sp. SYP-B2076]|uniref:sugar ABC transporter ATP-binding protein n=1 Tax=Georgenia sp. SYP-B2076 TaxID=2495881 RepID=UPI000F8E2100|nr:sugar ABC transporter ATP-binding protein [Georgenia sp. SYP-B2076]